MHYRSDWPEAGLSTAIVEKMFDEAGARNESGTNWVEEWRALDVTMRWIAVRSAFESQLYGFPIWEIRFEADDVESRINDDSRLNEPIRDRISRSLLPPPWGESYLFSRVLRTEPLYRVFLECGFQEVEERRLYKTLVRDIDIKKGADSEGHVRFVSLAEFTAERHDSLREGIREVSREVFGEKGFSRHFTDPFLLGRLPGVAYILAAMELNFRRLEPQAFLLAVDTSSDRVLGFTVVGRKSGLAQGMYTQLLSAVRKEFQGRDLYAGLTQLMVRTLPGSATLLNITHAGNHAIQSAYRRTGRIHLADTTVVRRVFHAGARTL